MRTLVAREVDPLERDTCGRDQSAGQLVLGADEREDGAVVVLVRVDVEETGARTDRGLDRRDGRVVSPLAEVRHRLERQHEPYSRSR